MAAPLPYLASNKDVETLFSKIQSAKVSDKFTHAFLQTSKRGRSELTRVFRSLSRRRRRTCW